MYIRIFGIIKGAILLLFVLVENSIEVHFPLVCLNYSAVNSQFLCPRSLRAMQQGLVRVKQGELVRSSHQFRDNSTIGNSEVIPISLPWI